MWKILNNNEEVNKFIETIFRNNKVNQKCEKENNVTDDYFVVEKTLKTNN